MGSFTYPNGTEKSLSRKYFQNGYVHQLVIYSTILESYGLKPVEDNPLVLWGMEVDSQNYDITQPDANLTIFEF